MSEKVELSKERIVSSIPRTDDHQDRWVYPSPRQFYEAIIRKGKTAQKEDADILVNIHNMVNEQTWQTICEWEHKMSIVRSIFNLKFKENRSLHSSTTSDHIGSQYPSSESSPLMEYNYEVNKQSENDGNNVFCASNENLDHQRLYQSQRSYDQGQDDTNAAGSNFLSESESNQSNYYPLPENSSNLPDLTDKIISKTKNLKKPSLIRFMGCPDRPSPRSLLYRLVYGYKKPFDRHDWWVRGGDGTVSRYIIDFYNGQPVSYEQKIQANRVYIDARPAIDSLSSLALRLALWILEE